jgi:hypothetical protein
MFPFPGISLPALARILHEGKEVQAQTVFFKYQGFFT